MKKLKNLFLLLMMLTVSLPAMAKTVTIMTDDVSKVTLRTSSNGSTWSGGSGLSHSLSNLTVGTVEVSTRYLLLHSESQKTVKVNGSSMSTSGTALNKYYKIDLNSYGDNVLLEIYQSRNASSNPYTYSLNMVFDDESNHVTGITTNKGGNYTKADTSVTFVYDEAFTVTTNKEASATTLSKGSSVEKNGNSYTFTPFPAPTAPTFSMTIPGDNAVYNFSAAATDDASMILGYEINGDADESTFMADDNIKVYTAYEPISYTGISNLTFKTDTYNGNYCYSTSFTAPAANVALNMTFNASFTTNIDATNLIYDYIATDVFGNTRTLEKTGVATFHKGDTFKLYCKYEPTKCEPAKNWTSTIYNGNNCYVASFTPTADGSLTITFNDGEFTVQIQDDESKIAELLSEYFVSYKVIHDDGTSDNLKHKYNTDSQTFSAYGSCITTFGVGDAYELVLKAEPEEILLNGDDLDYTSVEEQSNGDNFVKYRFNPTDDGRMVITFGTPTEVTGNEEATFKVYIKADRANVVNAQVRTSSGNTDIVIGTSDTEVECPESGYIYCTILDDSMYSFQTFKNTDENVDFLVYDPPTTYPVTIRKTRATSDTDMIDNSGDHFSITTNSKENLKWYSLNLNIADDASNVQVEVGTSNKANSQANRKIDNLIVGDNTINYSEEDTYLVVTSKNLRSLYQTTFDKGTVTKTEDWPAKFYMSLSAETANGNVVVTANEPIEEGDKTFTFNIDHPELVTALRRFVGGVMTSYEDITEFNDGDNTISFTVGDEFRIFLSGDYAPEYVKRNGEDIVPWSGLYDFTPAENDVVSVHFGTLPELSYFTVVTDQPTMVTEIYNYTRGKGYAVGDKNVTIEFFTGDEFQIRLGSRDPKTVTFNDEPVTLNGNFYQFTPTADGVLKVIFVRDPGIIVVRDLTLNFYIDGIDRLNSCSLTDASNTVNLVEGSLHDGVNTIKFADVDLPLTFSYTGVVDEFDIPVLHLDNETIAFTDGAASFNCADGQNLFLSVSGENEEVTTDGTQKITYVSHNDLYFSESVDAEVKAYVAVGYSDANMGIQFVRVTGVIPAGTGLLLVTMDRGTTQIQVNRAARSRVAKLAEGEEEGESHSIFEDNLLMPAYKYTTIPGGDESYDRYQFVSDGNDAVFAPVSDEIAADSNQAYLVLPKKANRPADFVITAGLPNYNGTTAIDAILAETDGAQGIYNINGVLINASATVADVKALPAGFYIINGHKVLVK